MIFHVYSAYDPPDEETKKRQEVAKMTWATQLWTNIPVRDQDLPRLWEEEGSKLPYLHDLFNIACHGADGNFIVVYTNADICVCSDCAMRVAGALQSTDAFYSYRQDFNHDFNEPIPDDVIARANGYCGSDFYAFRVKWWLDNKKDFPDLLIGREGWDPVLRHLMEITNPGKPVNAPNLCYHRKHGTVWENSKNRYRLRGQIYNLKLASYWLTAHGINPRSHGIPNYFR